MNDFADKQRTLSKEFTLRGKGLHTGIEACVTFHPATENHGYKIRRIDLPDKPLIPAQADHVVSTDRGTVLSLNGAQVSTVEHALAALYASGIDNCLIDVNAPEFPILDGSAIEYINQIKQSGVKEQSAKREYFIPREKIEYRDETSGSHLILLPSDTFKIHTKIMFDSPILDLQDATLNTISDFPTEFAMCRTFVFVKEIESLLRKGLIKGGDLNNAIVIYDTPIDQQYLDQLADAMNVERKDARKLGYIVGTPLRFPNEPARHKLLDILGDISLTGKFIKGEIISVRPGHQANNRFARIILDNVKKSAGKKRELVFAWR